MTTITLHAPAKLNVNLEVLCRREDGYHEIDTLMIRLPGLHDTLVVSLADTTTLEIDGSTLSNDESNLVLRAVRAYEARIGAAFLVSVRLEKRIPIGAGLGGGSSDAASTLLALDRISSSPLGPEALIELASGLGSDVPFFLMDGMVRSTGRGEIVRPVAADVPRWPVLVVKPQFSVATPDAYRRWSESAEIAGLNYRPQALDGFTLRNDLERPVFEKHRFLGELKGWLLARDETRAAMLCGSGSSMFAVLHEGADATELARAARHELDPTLWHWFGRSDA